MMLQSLVQHPRTINLGLAASRYVPGRLAYTVSSWVSTAVSRLQPEAYRIVCANLFQALGPEADRAVVGKTARRVIYYFLRGYYDLFRTLQLGPQELDARVTISDTLLSALASSAEQGRSMVLAMAHVGNFDLAGQLVARYTDRMQVLSLPDPPAGFVSLNALRERGGATMTPLTPAALRQAMRTLQDGGIVGLGADRPITNLDDLVPFFGQPAHMPSGHVRLALRTGAQVLIGCCPFAPDTGRYLVHVEPPLDMIHTGDRQEEMALNMRRVLDLTEKVIRQWADQWMMFVPVWPDPSGAQEAPCAS
ncbi:MAG: hypothetical protein JXA93_14435 [Anaerolineae bacterium]|nr:hypothetical protein [Anaerolineae bacterium]